VTQRVRRWGLLPLGLAVPVALALTAIPAFASHSWSDGGQNAREQSQLNQAAEKRAQQAQHDTPVVAPLSTSGAFTTANRRGGGHDIDHVSSSDPISSGRWVSVGFRISADGSTSRAATLSLQNAVATIYLSCTQGSRAPTDLTLTIPLPSRPHFLSAGSSGNAGWPWGRDGYDSGFQTSVTVPSGLCDGDPVYAARDAEVYSGTLASSDNTVDKFHIQFRTAIPAAAGGANVNCADPAQAASPPTLKACAVAWNGDRDYIIPSATKPPASVPAAQAPKPAPTPATSQSPAPPSAVKPNPTPATAPSRIVITPPTDTDSPPTPAPTPAPRTTPATPPPTSSPPPVVVLPGGITSPPTVLLTGALNWLPYEVILGAFLILLVTLVIASRRRRRSGGVDSEAGADS
jgi:hypothetical protein